MRRLIHIFAGILCTQPPKCQAQGSAEKVIYSSTKGTRVVLFRISCSINTVKMEPFLMMYLYQLGTDQIRWRKY